MRPAVALCCSWQVVDLAYTPGQREVWCDRERYHGGQHRHSLDSYDVETIGGSVGDDLEWGEEFIDGETVTGPVEFALGSPRRPASSVAVTDINRSTAERSRKEREERARTAALDESDRLLYLDAAIACLQHARRLGWRGLVNLGRVGQAMSAVVSSPTVSRAMHMEMS